MFAFTPRVIGQFGTDSERAWDCTFGLNTKGGMDDWEFELYIINSILPLYPNTLDTKPPTVTCLLLPCSSTATPNRSSTPPIRTVSNNNGSLDGKISSECLHVPLDRSCGLTAISTISQRISWPKPWIGGCGRCGCGV